MRRSLRVLMSGSLGLAMVLAGVPALGSPPPAATPTTSRPAQPGPRMPLLHGNRVHHPAPGSLHAKGETLRPVKRTVPAGRRVPFSAAATTVGWDAADLQSAYALPSTTGGVGRTVAVVDAFDAPNLESDLATYRSANGLAPCTTANGCLTKVAQDGSTAYPPASNVGWAAETTLDAEMISAACPNCHIVVVEADSDFTTDLLAGVDEATSLSPDAVSMSWGGPEFSQETSDDAHFVGKGDIKFFASAGDDGTSNVSWPAASPDVLSVGGTDLYQSGSTGRAWYETPWAGSTHGCSAYESAPSWQTASTGCGGMRADNDISADAGTAMALYYTPPGSGGAASGSAIRPAGGGWGVGWQGAGGTSASSPFLAALYLLTHDPRVLSDALGLLYQLAYELGADAVNEIAGLLGYELATGLGSPNGEIPGLDQRLLEELLAQNAGEADGAPCMKGDPVECATGNLSEPATDLRLPGRGRFLHLSRTYNSRVAATATTPGPFGYGWSSSYGSSLSVDATTGAVTVSQDTGTTLSFVPDGNGGYGAAGWVIATLRRGSDGTWTVTYPDQTTNRYDSTGQLVAETDRAGETTTLGYSGAQLATVTDPAGRHLSFTYDAAGRVSSVADGTGRTARYGYDSAGNLTSVTDPTGAVTRYGYDSQHRLTSLTDPNGGTTTNVYDASARVVSQTDPMQRTSTWSYDTSAGTTTYTDPGGTVEVMRYNAYGQLVSATKAAGTAQASTWTYAYAPGTGELESRIDPAGHTTLYAWDGAGNLTATTDPLGRTRRWTYDGANEPTTATDPSGTTTTTTYTAHHEPATVTVPLTASTSATTSFAYSAAHPGDLTAVTDANGHTTRIGHDAYGDTASVTDADGDVRTASYDERGDLTSATTARGFTSTYTYDADGRRTSATDALGHTTTLRHDGDGNVVAVTDANGHTTATSYDADNEVTRVVKPDGATTSYGYDAAGRRVSVTDGNGHAWTQRYDALGRVVAATDPMGRTTSYGYDPAGNPATRTTATGVTATASYDAANEPIGVSYSDGTTPAVAYNYDADGRRHQMLDGSGLTTYAYDLAGRLTSTTDGNGNAVTYGYDAVGNVTTLGYPTGITVTRTFDPADRLSAVDDGAGNVTDFGYDADGNLATEAFPNGVTTTYGYDKDDQALSVADATSTATLASFSYSRTAVGQVASMASDLAGAAGVTDSYTYTSDNQVATDSTSAVTTTTFGYDKAGNLTATGAGTLSYDPASEVTSRTATGGVVSTTYGYNADGDRTSITAAGQTVALDYDGADRLTGYGSAARYTYNGDGLRMDKTVGIVNETFAWDTVTTRTPLVLTDGTNDYIYGPGGRAIEQLSLGLVATYLHQDALGSTRLLTGTNGAVVGGFAYSAYGSPAGAVTKTGNTVATPIGFAGGYTDSESGLVYLVNRYYDPGTGQFITRDPLQSLTGAPYGYALGDPLDLTDPLGLCSWSICTTVSSAANAIGNAVSGAVTFVYDNASTISAYTGVAAVALAPFPVVDVLSPVLGEISVYTGALATGKDLGSGNIGQAVVDGAGTVVGAAGLYQDIQAILLSADARAAWDTADLYLAQDLAHLAEEYEGTGLATDILAAALGQLGLETERTHLFGC